MGLDIYLYTREQMHANQLCGAASEALYGRADYGSLSTEERKALSDTIPEYSLAVDVPSEKYPIHVQISRRGAPQCLINPVTNACG